jgi:urea transport system permease protein
MIWVRLCLTLAGLVFVASTIGAQAQEAKDENAMPTAPGVVALSEPALAALEGIFLDDFEERSAALRRLGSLPDPQVSVVLFALQEERLFRLGKDLFMQGDSAAISLRSGQRLAQEPSSPEYPVLNNRLRAELDQLLARFSLTSDDPDQRSQAIKSLLDAPEGIDLAAVVAARDKESRHDLRAALALLTAIGQYQEAHARNSLSEKTRAVEEIARYSLPQAEAFLRAARTESQDSALTSAIDEALASIAAQRARGAVANTLFTGISLGSILLLAALGLAISYGLIGVINMAHGEFLMLGAYTTFLVQVFFQAYLPTHWFDWYLVIAVPAAFLVCAGFGLLVEWLILRHLYGRPLETLLATFGLSLIMMQAVRVLFGAQNVQVANPSWMSGAMTPLQSLLPGLMIPHNRLVIVGFSLAVLLITWLVLTRTQLGLFIRGTTQNRTMAGCVGIATRKVDSMAFGLGTGVAGLGGVALSQIGNVGPDLGQAYIIDSFMVVVLGGVGQLAGAVVGAFGLGVASKFAEPFLGAVLAKIAILVLIILFIQKRPSGLFALKGRSAEL